MVRGGKAALVSCSNARRQDERARIQKLTEALQEMGLVPVADRLLYEGQAAGRHTDKERARILMDFYRDPAVRAIFDVSGGDIANGILPYLDYGVIAGSDKLFFGYSDLTTVINALYGKAGKESVLYQVKNLVGEYGEVQKRDFEAFWSGDEAALTGFSVRFIQGKSMGGIAVGGNIRCFLKLAGTPYWPDLKGRILVLEALGGKRAQITAYLSQLSQIGAFVQASGILLGTFTEMEREEGVSAVCGLVKYYAGPGIPIAKSQEIGHGEDSKAVVIGRYMELWQ